MLVLRQYRLDLLFIFQKELFVFYLLSNNCRLFTLTYIWVFHIEEELLVYLWCLYVHTNKWLQCLDALYFITVFPYNSQIKFQSYLSWDGLMNQFNALSTLINQTRICICSKNKYLLHAVLNMHSRISKKTKLDLCMNEKYRCGSE